MLDGYKLDIPRGFIIREPYDTVLPIFEEYISKLSKNLSHLDNGQFIEFSKKVFDDSNASNQLVPAIALKIIESRRFIERDLKDNIRIDIITPIFKEIKRIKPRSKVNPFGENALLNKIYKYRFMEHLSGDRMDIHFWIVDDDCPEHSGDRARMIIKNNYPEEYNNKYHVLFLKDVINDGIYPPKNSAQGSIKGGSFHYGLREVLKQTEHIKCAQYILDSDMDISVHPEMLGLLLKSAMKNNYYAVIGSRRQDDSVSLIDPYRDRRGRLFIAILEKLLPEIHCAHIYDTNRGFKLYKRNVAECLYNTQKELQFPYQIEDIIVTLRNFSNKVGVVGICYVDSMALSTTSSSYYSQIIRLVDLSNRYYSPNHEKELKEFLHSMGRHNWSILENTIPNLILSTPVEDLYNLNLLEILRKHVIDYCKTLKPKI